MTSTTEAPTTKKDTREKTGYVVLEKSGEASWKRVATITAANAEAAIRSYLPHATKDPGAPDPDTYVAIPARSWKPVTVKTETKTVVTLA